MGGGGVVEKILSLGEVWIFSGITQSGFLVFFLIRSHVTDAIATAAGDDCIRIFEQVINYVDLTDYNRS